MFAARVAYGEELDILARIAPYMSAESRRNKALAAVANRTVESRQGTLILPPYQTVQSFFGVPAATGPDYVGRALAGLFKPEVKGGSIQYNILPSGGLQVQQYDESGNRIRGLEVSRESVKERVLENLAKDVRQVDREVGSGKPLRDNKGNIIHANGLNTAGVAHKDMLLLRGDLVKSEEIRGTAYTDTEGVKTFGVGLSTLNTFWEEPANPDGTYTEEQVHRTFAAASNEAAEVAVRSLEAAGIPVTGEAVRFLGEVAYQSQREARNPDLLAAIATGNYELAEAAFKATSNWRVSGVGRRAQYLRKLKQMME